MSAAEKAAIASAIAAGISALAALAALLAVRNTNKIARASILPFLEFSESTGFNDFLTAKNTGKGPALNFKFVPLTNHYLDTNWMFEYSTPPKNIPAGESVDIEVVTLDVRSKKAEKTEGSAFDILYFAKESKDNTVTAIFNDITGYTHAINLAFDIQGNKWALRSQNYFSFSSRKRFSIWLKKTIFRSRIMAWVRLRRSGVEKIDG